MLDNSKFLIISAIFILVFIVFIAFSPGNYSSVTNEQTSIIVGVPERQKDNVMAAANTAEGSGTEKSSLRAAVITGSGNGFLPQVTETVLFTFDSLKLSYMSYETVQAFAEQTDSSVELLVITTPDIAPESLAAIKEFLAGGGNVVFAVMPLWKYLSVPEYQDFLGIINVGQGYIIEGLDIYEGVMLGGLFRSQDFSFECYEVLLEGNCKVLASGFDLSRNRNIFTIPREQLCPLVWRTYYEGGAVFAVNAPFMEKESGAGILTGIVAMTSETLIYPIIGAKVVLLENFPYIAPSEQTISNRSVFAFFRDIIWPDLVSIAAESNLVYTCVSNGEFAKNNRAAEIVQFFTNNVYKDVKGEVGYFVNGDDAVLENDLRFLNEQTGGYRFYTFMASGQTFDEKRLEMLAPQMTAVFFFDKGEKTVSWLTEQAVSLPVISRDVWNVEGDLDFFGLMSVTGMIIHSVDMSKPLETGNGQSQWNFFGIELARYFSYMFQNTGFIPSMTASRAAEEVKDYLNTEYDIRYMENGIWVGMNGNYRERPFILRTRKRVTGWENCTVQEIEDNVYTVWSQGPEFQVVLT